MLYSLPNGKTVELSLDEYLNLTDEDIQEMMASNYGYNINSPFFNSSIHKKTVPKDFSELDYSLDYSEESEETNKFINITEILTTLDNISIDNQDLPESLIEHPNTDL